MDQLLASLDLLKFSQKFKDEDIDLDAAKKLSEDDMKELGLTLGARKKLLSALQPEAGAASVSSVGQSGNSSTATPAPVVDKPITGLFKAKDIGYNYNVQANCYYTPEVDDGKIYAISKEKFFVYKKGAQLVVEREITPPKPDTSLFDGYILAGRGDLLVSPYKKGYSGPDAGLLMYSRSKSAFIGTHDILQHDDTAKGVAFVSDSQLVMRLRMGSQKDEIWLVDAETGEPIQRHCWGTNAYSDHGYGRYNNLHSSYHQPNIFMHNRDDKIEIRDVRQSIHNAVSIWTGTPANAQVYIDNHGWNGVPRVVLNGTSPLSHYDNLVQVWDLRKGEKLFSVDKEHSLKEATIYKNVLVTAEGGGCGGTLHFWDLTKAQFDSDGVLHGPTTKTLTGGDSSWQLRHNAFAWDDKHFYFGSKVVQLSA